MNQLGLVEKRQRNLRIVFFVIILGTLPLYCLGFLLWGTAPASKFLTPTYPPVTAGFTLQATNTQDNVLPSVTPFNFPTQNVNLPPSPYFPPVQVTRFLSPTATFYIFPTSTFAPTLTLTPAPLPTDTALPIPTDTPIPTDIPQPSPTDTTIPPASDTPTPTPTDTVIPAP